MADRYLLESSAVDGYLLEDGTGVLLLEVAAPTIVVITAAVVAYTPQAMTVSVQTRAIITAASIAYAAQAIIVNAQKRIAITAASLSITGQAIVVNAKTMIQVTAATVSYVARSIVVTVASAFVGRGMKNLRVQRWAANWRRIHRGR